MEAGRQRQILFGIMYIMHRNASIFASRQQRNCCHTGRLSLCWSKSATSHCSPVLQLDYKPKCFCPLKLKKRLDQGKLQYCHCWMPSQSPRGNTTSENPKFWSNQTGLTSCLKWLNWIWISFFVWNPVRERYWIDHFVRIRYHTDVRALFPKDSNLTPLFLWHVWRPR